MKPEDVKQTLTISLPNFIVWMIDKEAENGKISKEKVIEEVLEFVYNGSILNDKSSGATKEEASHGLIEG